MKCKASGRQVPLRELWEVDPLLHARRGRVHLCIGPLLHVFIIVLLTVQVILLVNSSALFGRNIHENWVTWLLPDGATVDFGGSPLTFPGDEFFAYRSSLVLDTVDSVITGYFTRLNGETSNVLNFIEIFGVTPGVKAPVIAFTARSGMPAVNASDGTGRSSACIRHSITQASIRWRVAFHCASSAQPS